MSLLNLRLNVTARCGILISSKR